MKQTIKEQLDALYSIQSIDTKLYHIFHLRGTLPMEVETLKNDYNKLTEKLNQKLLILEESKSIVDIQKADIKEKQAILVRYENQKNEISNSREFDSISKAIELNSLDIQLAEKRIKNNYNLIENLQPEIAEMKLSIETVAKKIKDKEQELQSTITDQANLEKDLLSQRQKFLPLVDPEILSNYDKVRNKLSNGLAAVKVFRGACGACFMLVTAQKQIDIASQILIQRCDHCGAILLDASLRDIPETGVYTESMQNEQEAEGLK